MKTIRPITEADIAALRAEQQVYFRHARMLLPQRIVDRITIDGECWRVKGWGTGNGFANIKVRNKTHKVHRVIFTLIRGPIPEDRPLLDHKKAVGCRFRDCCNDKHLEPVTNRENVFRGEATLMKKESEYA